VQQVPHGALLLSAKEIYIYCIGRFTLRIPDSGNIVPDSGQIFTEPEADVPQAHHLSIVDISEKE